MEKIKSKKYNIVLMDIQMPGINGFEVTRILRSKEDSYFKSVPIIAVSASSSQHQQDTARLVGMNHYLIKPYYPDELKLLLIKFGDYKIPIIGTVLPEKLVHHSVNDNALLSIEKRIDEFSGSNDTFKLKLIDSFIEGFQELLSEFKKSIKTRDLKDLRRIHHKLKSSMIILKLDDLNSIMETSKSFLLNEIELEEKELLSSFEGYILKLKDLLMQLRRQIKIKLRVNNEDDVLESNDQPK
jgi:CheY-like chemotaxis protein